MKESLAAFGNAGGDEFAGGGEGSEDDLTMEAGEAFSAIDELFNAKFLWTFGEGRLRWLGGRTIRNICRVISERKILIGHKGSWLTRTTRSKP